MSRIGKNPVEVPAGVTATVEGNHVTVKGPKGELKWQAVSEIVVKLEDGAITVNPRDESKRARAMWGLGRSLIQNLVTGVTDGYSKTLEINGVGYRAAQNGKTIDFSLGLSHPLAFTAPDGIELKVTKPTEIVVSGIDKQKVGQVAAVIRGFRPPEPYQGKGIKYSDEIIVRKEGKKKK